MVAISLRLVRMLCSSPHFSPRLALPSRPETMTLETKGHAGLPNIANAASNLPNRARRPLLLAKARNKYPFVLRAGSVGCGEREDGEQAASQLT